MTLQQIMYFQRVARSGSFTKAARACFVSQTAISRQICALEEELHVTLLERDTAHVKLTLAGEYFFQQVNELTARLEEVVTRTQTIAQEQQTRLTLGIPTILEQHAISQLLRQYHSLHPEVQLSTVAGSRQQLVSQLVDRKIDLLVAMDFDLPDLEGLDSIILQQVHATWLLPTGHPPCRSGKDRAAAAAGRNADPDSRGPPGQHRGAAAPVLQSTGSERKPGPSHPDAGGAVPAGQRRGGHRAAALFRAQIPAPGPVQRAHRRPAVELQLPAHLPPGAQPRQRARHV